MDLSLIPELVGVLALCPTDFTCRLSADGRSVTLDWSNVVPYQSIAILRDGRIIQRLEGDEESFTDHDMVCGTVVYQLVPIVLGIEPCETPPECKITDIPPPGVDLQFVRADTNADGRVNISDPVTLLSFLFAGEAPPSCQKSADADDNGTVNISDATVILNYLFAAGPRPAPPFRECCTDPTEDSLGCLGIPQCP